MNRSILIGIVAFLTGAGTGYFVARKLLDEKYAQLAQEEIDSVKETFRWKYEEKDIIGHVTKVTEEDDGLYVEVSDERPKTANKVVGLIREEKDKTAYGAAKTSYHEMAKEDIRKRWDERNSLAREMPDDEEIDEDDKPLKDAAGYEEGDFIDYGTERDLTEIDRTKPYEISDREYSEEFDHHDKISLYYYSHDDTLCDENEEIVDNIDDTVGWEVFKTLEMQTSAWVRNEPLGIDYEICVVRNSYAEAVHGIHETKVLSPRERHMQQMKRRGHDEDGE